MDKTSLIAWWSMDEASGHRADSHTNGLTLTDNNTVGSTTGKKGNAADFELSNSEFLERADEALLSTGDIDFTVACWVNLESKPVAFQRIVDKSASLSVREFSLLYNNNSLDRFQFIVYDSGGSAVGEVRANNLGSPSTATWYFIVAWHDSVANTINIQVNNGTADSVASTGVPSDTTANFRVGARFTTEQDFLDGLIDEVSFWKRVLTADEKTWLYNSGNGRTYSELSESDFFIMF